MSTSLQIVEQVEEVGPWVGYDVLDSPFESYSFERVGSGVLRFDLDDMPPGPSLAWTLSGIDVDSLSGHDRVIVLRAHQRMVAHHQAMSYDAMQSIHASVTEAADDLTGPDIGEIASAEIQCALHLTRRMADIELSFALDLARRLPDVLRMLSSGIIDQRRARVIERGTIHLTAAAAGDVVEKVAASAPEMTTGQLAARIRKLCIEADPHDAQERYRASVADRKVIVEATVDGTADLIGLNLPPDRVTAIRRRIEHLAKGLRRGGETRTMDQLRADVLLDLLEGSPSFSGDTRGAMAMSDGGERTCAPRPVIRSRSGVHLTVDLSTLAGLVDHAGDLAGYGPVIADIARRVADENPDAQWTYSITDPEHGNVLHTGITRRRPTANQQRHIRAKHQACCWPGCRAAAVDCDLDHTTRFADGGATCPCNQVPLCRHHHVMRHSGFTYTVDHRDRVSWTTPLGHSYVTWRAPP